MQIWQSERNKKYSTEFAFQIEIGFKTVADF